MINLAIQIAWLLIGIIALAGVLWLFLYGIREFVYAIPAQLEKGIWFVFFLLVIIAVLSMFAGGGGSALRFPKFG